MVSSSSGQTRSSKSTSNDCIKYASSRVRSSDSSSASEEKGSGSLPSVLFHSVLFPRDFASLIEELGRLGIDFVSIRESFDTSSPMGRAMMYIASVFSQLERETIAERIRDNMHELAKTGRWLGGTTPTGYASESVKSITVDGKAKKACKLKLLPDEAEIIYKIFDLYEQYDSLTMTETELLRQGIKTKTGRSFTRSSIKSSLQNPVYLIADKDAYPYFVDNEAELFAPESDFDGVPVRSQEKRQALHHKLQ